MLLSEAINLFLGQHIPTTRETYRQSLNPMAEFIGPARPLDSLSVVHLLEWSSYIRAYKKSDGKLYADATLHKHIKTVRTFFNWCIKTGFMEQSPAVSVKQQKVVREIDSDDAMTDEEYEKLLTYFRERSRYLYLMQRNLALHLFMGDTGCRSGGAGGARWEDIDFDNKTAVLTEKGNKRNTYYFGDECAQELKRWKYHKKNMSLIYVFGREDQPLSAGAIKSMYYRACETIELDKVRAGHSLRHRKGMQLAESGVPITTGQLVLNHEDIRSTEVYYPKSRRLAEEASRRLVHRPASDEDTIIRIDQKRRTQ